MMTSQCHVTQGYPKVRLLFTFIYVLSKYVYFYIIALIVHWTCSPDIFKWLMMTSLNDVTRNFPEIHIFRHFYGKCSFNDDVIMWRHSRVSQNTILLYFDLCSFKICIVFRGYFVFLSWIFCPVLGMLTLKFRQSCAK